VTRTLALTLPLLALALGACRTNFGGYVADRVNDTVDIVPFSVASGPGFYVGARLTVIAGVGVGYAETSRAGWRRRPVWTDDPEKLAGFRRWHEREKGFVVFWDRTDDPEPGAGNLGVVVPAYTRESAWDYRLGFEPGSALDAEVEVHLFYVGLRVGVSPLQAIDWLAGWFLLDPAGDDLHNRLEDTTRPLPQQPREAPPSRPSSAPRESSTPTPKPSGA
jgi:hypothetical protein